MKVYLGDSVYVDNINGMLCLTTENGFPDDPRNKIYLEPEVFEALIEYVVAMRREMLKGKELQR